VSVPCTERVMLALRWLRQLVCIHGPVVYRDYPKPRVDGPYGFEYCQRCGKTITRFYRD
jgi:hypothetical protein